MHVYFLYVNVLVTRIINPYLNVSYNQNQPGLTCDPHQPTDEFSWRNKAVLVVHGGRDFIGVVSFNLLAATSRRFHRDLANVLLHSVYLRCGPL